MTAPASTNTAANSVQIIGQAFASKFSLKELDDMQIKIAESLPTSTSAENDILALEYIAEARALVKAEDERLIASRTILREI